MHSYYHWAATVPYRRVDIENGGSVTAVAKSARTGGDGNMLFH
jgi:hypothetical protein